MILPPPKFAHKQSLYRKIQERMTNRKARVILSVYEFMFLMLYTKKHEGNVERISAWQINWTFPGKRTYHPKYIVSRNSVLPMEAHKTQINGERRMKSQEKAKKEIEQVMTACSRIYIASSGRISAKQARTAMQEKWMRAQEENKSSNNSEWKVMCVTKENITEGGKDHYEMLQEDGGKLRQHYKMQYKKKCR